MEPHSRSAEVFTSRPSRIPYSPFSAPNIAPAMPSRITAHSHRNSTLVHRGFYDLLSLVPGTPGVGVGSRASRMWREDELVRGPRYEDLRSTGPPRTNNEPSRPNNNIVRNAAVSPTRAQERTSPKGKRRISKDMVSRPMGFVHLVHASDADQAEALLNRWGPDGIGKLGDPNWAQPIKSHIRTKQQDRAVAEVMHALNPTPSTSSVGPPVLRVVNGVSSSTLTTSTVASTPVTEKTYSRLGYPNSSSRLGLGPPLETQHEHSGEASNEARVGHESEGSEVTIKGRAVVPTPPKQAKATVSQDMGRVEAVMSMPTRQVGAGTGYPTGIRDPGRSYQPPRSLGLASAPTRSPEQPIGQRSPGQPAIMPYSPTQPVPYSPTQTAAPYPLAQQPEPWSPFAPTTPPKDFAPPTSPKTTNVGYDPSPKRNLPPASPRQFQPATMPVKRSASKPLPIPGAIGAAEDPLAMYAAELMKGVNGGNGLLGSPPVGALSGSPTALGVRGTPGSPGTIRIHPEGTPLPAPSPGAWGGVIREDGGAANSSGTGSGGIGVPRGFTNSIIGGKGDKWNIGAEIALPPKPFRPSLATLDKAVSAKIYFENVYFPLLRLPPSREQRRLAMEAEMEQLNIPQHTRDQIRAKWRENETAYLRERRRRVDQRSFIKLKTIGHGAFGVVSLVQEKETGELYAMKQMRKVDMLRKGQEGHVRAERDILKSAALVSSPTGADWIVRLFYSFQDQDHLYLVLEFMGGGDLLNLLIEKDIFEENFARFYIAEMVLAIEQCHKQGFIHRDIKPDNFLFDPNGHIKLSDFGLATDLHWAHDTSYYEQQRRDLLHKHGIDLEDGESRGQKHANRMNKFEADRLMGGEGVFTWREKNRKKLAYSVCGTNSYMSPEVIRGQGYSFSCDWWSLGVIMFECLYGYPPFVSNSRHVTRQKILNWRTSLRFPPRPRISREGVDLIERLLCEPEDRIGAQGGLPPNMNRRSGFLGGGLDGAADIKAHPWFKSIDFARIHEWEAPFKPELQRPDDTKHFDPDITPEPLAPANGAPPDATRDPLLRDKVHGPYILESRKALAFAGFTHKSPRKINYARVDAILKGSDDSEAQEVHAAHGGYDEQRGRSILREQGTIGRSRAISM